MIKAVIFDMDGVLIEAKDWHYDALNKALSLFGYNINRYDHLTIYDGLPTSKKLEMLSFTSGLPRGLHHFINEMKQQYTMQMVNNHCKPLFIHEYALSKLKASGYRLSVASNSIRATVEIMMQKARLEKYLDLMLSNEDVENAKPSPDIYNKTIQLLGLMPHECLIVEDNDNGIKAAQASGANVMIVKDISEVNFLNITNRIEALNK